MTWLLDLLKRLLPSMWRRKTPPAAVVESVAAQAPVPIPDAIESIAEAEAAVTLAAPDGEPPEEPSPDEPEATVEAGTPTEEAAGSNAEDEAAEAPPPAEDLTGEAFEDEEEDSYDPDEEVDIEDADELAVAPTAAQSRLEREKAQTLRLRRAEARDTALAGEHRIYLADPAGPGTMAEALNALVQEGLVAARFEEDEEAGPYILYRPTGEPGNAPAPVPIDEDESMAAD